MIKYELPEPTGGSLRILRMRDVRERLQLSPSHIFSLIARGDFPKPFVLVPGGRAVGWLEHQIDQWILDRRGNNQQGYV
jgi:prophage regulatory protein